MYIKDGIASAGEPIKELEIKEVKKIDDMMLLLTFSTGEKRLYDATKLLTMPAFQPLKDKQVFDSMRLEYGVVVWCDGDIDIAPETMYRDSFVYNEPLDYM